MEQLLADFEQFSFVPDGTCRWSPAEMTICYADGDEIGLLHELGHALCAHNSFAQDVELLHIERDAWEKARELGDKYGVKIDDETVEIALDGYRDWLHNRSKCPRCGQNGVQGRSDSLYRCLNCATVWNTNDARQAALRRYKQAK